MWLYNIIINEMFISKKISNPYKFTTIICQYIVKSIIIIMNK